MEQTLEGKNDKNDYTSWVNVFNCTDQLLQTIDKNADNISRTFFNIK